MRLVLAHLAGSAVRRRIEIDDLLQEVYLRALTASGGLPAPEPGEGALRRFLNRIARHVVIDAAREILKRCHIEAEIKTDPTKPTGPYNRVSDNTLARRLLGWKPKVRFSEGLDRAIQWFFSNHDKQKVANELERALTERGI